jgi:hypothetical protein
MENVPASGFYSRSMENAYTVYNLSSNTSALCQIIGDNSFDDSGDTSMAMWAKWQVLSSSTTTATLIPNFIFIDYTAAAVVRTKGSLGPGNTTA